MINKVTDRKIQIIEESTHLFSSDGYDRVTVKSIGAVCGITEPAVYKHFNSKEDIYIAVLESLKSKLDYEAVFDELRNESDVEALLKGLAKHIISFFTKRSDMYRLLLYSALSGHDKAGQIYNQIRGSYQKFLREQLDRLYSEGKILKKNNDITARCFTGMVFDCALGKTLWRGMQGKVYDPSKVIANNVPIYARGLKK